MTRNRDRTSSKTKRSFWYSRQKFATIPICLFMEAILGATAFSAWMNENWDGIGIVIAAALILTAFPYGMFWVTNVGEPRRTEGERPTEEKEQSA